MCEEIHAIEYHAARRSRNKKLRMCLTGGRKTMSTDLQKEAAWFGCTAMIHVVEDTEHPGLASSRIWPAEIFSAPLSKESANVFTPFVVGHFPPSPLLAVVSSEVLPFDPASVVFSDILKVV